MVSRLLFVCHASLKSCRVEPSSRVTRVVDCPASPPCEIGLFGDRPAPRLEGKVLLILTRRHANWYGVFSYSVVPCFANLKVSSFFSTALSSCSLTASEHSHSTPCSQRLFAQISPHAYELHEPSPTVILQPPCPGRRYLERLLSQFQGEKENLLFRRSWNSGDRFQIFIKISRVCANHTSKDESELKESIRSFRKSLFLACQRHRRRRRRSAWWRCVRSSVRISPVFHSSRAVLSYADDVSCVGGVLLQHKSRLRSCLAASTASLPNWLSVWVRVRHRVKWL